MREVEIPEEVEEFRVDFEVDRGRVIHVITIVPEMTKPCRLMTIGAVGRSSSKNFDEPHFDILALASGEERTLIIHDKANQFGKVLQVSEQDSPDALRVKLEPCVTIRGRLVDDNETPISGARIHISPRPGGDYSPELESATTDEKGHFEHAGVLPGTTYAVMAESVQKGFTTLAKNLAVEPGETIDLGKIDVTSDERPVPVRTKPAGTEADSGNVRVRGM